MQYEPRLITKFKEKTAGHKVAVGDIKAILALTLGKAKTLEQLN